MSTKIAIYIFAFLLSFSAFAQQESETSFLISFGSCNKVEEPNPFWSQIYDLQPDLFIWGGDNIYADTDDMAKMKAIYERQNKITAYAKVKQSIPMMATWDDHDYGKNDAGREFSKKEESQQLFLDFMGVPEDDKRRKREGVYHMQDFFKNGKKIKVIALDTRYFRSPLEDSQRTDKRYEPLSDSSGTMLGKKQWQWFENILDNSDADYNIIMSSIQLLSAEHGFETWANLPGERSRFLKLIEESDARAVIVLSGDRHISEFSRKALANKEYPLIDFTSSGLTHAYTRFDGEPNKHRVGEVVAARSFGLVHINLENNEVSFSIIGAEGDELEKLEQAY